MGFSPTLQISGETLIFNNFHFTSEYVTIGLLHQGIMIYPYEKTDHYNCYPLYLSNERVVDSVLSMILKERGIKEETVFIKHQEHYYELYPHAEKYEKGASDCIR